MDDPGSLLLGSHDRFFLDTVATHTRAYNADLDTLPRWELYEGNPTSVRRLRAERALEAPKPESQAKVRTETREPARRKPGLSQKEERRLAELEAAMAVLHTRIQALETLMAGPAAFITAEAPGHQALKDRDGCKAELEALEMEWLELEEKRAM